MHDSVVSWLLRLVIKMAQLLLFLRAFSLSKYTDWLISHSLIRPYIV